MIILDEVQTREALAWDPLIGALRRQFATVCVSPARHHHDMAVPGEAQATLLIMPAWEEGGYQGVKVVNVVPGNGARGLPAIHGSYLLSSATTGAPCAILDGGELTARRTAAASALAADYLARPDAERLLVVGAGRLSLNLLQAHARTRPIRSAKVWARREEQARAVAARAGDMGLRVEVASDLEAAVREADIVSCCTLSTGPLVRGDWVRPGTHVDLVGAFKPTMRETDDRLMGIASIFVDTREGAFAEAGDILQALQSGAIGKAAILADLFDLAGNRHAGRANGSEITVFKSVGASLEDLAAARLAYETSSGRAAP